SGCTSLMWPLGMILPEATATMSTVPSAAQAMARQAATITVAEIARPIGEGGVSTISSAAGRKASSERERRGSLRLVDAMDTCLQSVKGGIAAGGADQLFVGAVLDQAAFVDGQHAIGDAQRRQAVGDDDDGAAAHDLAHVLLDDALAFVVECAGRLV